MYERARQNVLTAETDVRVHGDSSELVKGSFARARGYRHINSTDEPGSLTLAGVGRQFDRCYQVLLAYNVVDKPLSLTIVFDENRRTC